MAKVIICSHTTHNPSYESRRTRCRSTFLLLRQKYEIDFFWIYGHDKQGFIGQRKNMFNENEIVLNCPDDYDHLPQKTKQMCSYFLDHFEFDYLFKCDDDTFIDFKKFQTYNNSELSEHDYVGNEWTLGANYASGGAGYFLSRRSCKIIAKSNLDIGAEDLLVGLLLQENGIIFNIDERFIPYGNDELRPLPGNKIITTHACGIPFDKFNVSQGQHKVSFIPQGGLGNLLFQWAAALSYSLKFGHQLVLMADLQNYASFFLRFPVENISKSISNLRTVGDPYDFSFEHLEYHNGDVLLGGFKYSEKYFINYKKIILNHIKKNVVENQLDYTNSVAVHVRRGDFLFKQQHHPVCGNNYYYLAFQRLFKLTKIDNIIISSDDIHWCQENLVHYINDKSLTFLEGSPIDDLINLSNCNHNIICCSSFSLWSVYLNENPEKIVICPDEYLGVAFIEQGYKEEDIIKPKWHRVKNVDYHLWKYGTLENGSWTSTDNSGHIFDQLLCKKIIGILQSEAITSVIDVGCGDGSYTKELINAGLNCLGYDGNTNTEKLTQGLCQAMDFSQPVPLDEKFDCVISLEVGEHIPPIFECTFIDNLCKLSNNLIIISWALPGQGGWGHYNERSNTYIKTELSKRGFSSEDVLEKELKVHVSDSCSWFRNSIMVFRKKKQALKTNMIGPVKKIPYALLNAYTRNQTIPVFDWYLDDSLTGIHYSDWNKEYVESFIHRFTKTNILKNLHGGEHYGGAASLHCMAFDTYSIKDKYIAVIGSLDPWIEAICINYGCHIISTVAYNVPVCDHAKINTISYQDFTKTKNKYDVVVSFSSIEHSGLGRYGDSLNPNGDLETMHYVHQNLKNNGLLFLGIPVGQDALSWNAHRVYGNLRLPLLFKGFNILEWFGVDPDYINYATLGNNGPQPVIVARKQNL